MKELEHIKAFSLAQSDMETALKNATNPFHKNKYADLTAIQLAVYPSFLANGFAILQIGGADEFGKYIETKFIHTSGGEFSGKVYLEYKANDMQSLGGAITYARRYGLSSMSGVPVEDDDGNAASGITTKFKQVQQAPQAPQEKEQSKQAKQDQKLTPPTQIREPRVARGIKLKKWLKEATAATMMAREIEAKALINDLYNYEVVFADELSQAWENRAKELKAKGAAA